MKCDNLTVMSRFGHTGVIYHKKLIIFGGKYRINNNFFMADLEEFHLEDKVWSAPIIYTKGTLKLRSNHVAELLGN